MIDYDKVMRIGKQVLEDMYHRGYFDGQKDMPHDVVEAYNNGYADAEKKHFADLDYKNGLEDGRMEAWECARKISNMTMDECEKIFGEYRYLATILPNVSASEAIAKMKEYEQTDEMSMEYAITTLKYQYDNGQMEQNVHKALGMAIKSMEYIDDHAL